MTFRPILAALPLLTGTLLLAACGDEAAKGDGRSAAGEVLEGTISDAMLPLDEVRSQSPLAGPEKPAGEATGKTEAPAAEGEEGSSDNADTPATAEKPAPPVDPIGAAVEQNSGQ